MGFAKDVQSAYRLISQAFEARVGRKKLRQKITAQAEYSDHHFTIGVYFADGPENLYQVRQWYSPLAELSQKWPTVVMSRHALTATQLLDESPLPVAYVRTVGDLEDFIATQDLQIIFYVNQNARNFQMFRYGQRWHVFINHGESDKMYMTTNQFKAYDYALIAGDAARNRLSKVLWDYDLDKRTIKIGRPQADHYADHMPFVDNGRPVVLYAPTWEGDRPSAAYGSILTHGVSLIEALIASGTYRIIYRPHPRSGLVSSEYGHAHQTIKNLLRRANADDPTAGHIIDEGPELGWQLAVAQMAVVDISAMVYDRLATGKPLIVTKPTNPQAEIDTDGFLGDCDWLEASESSEIVRLIEQVEQGKESLRRLSRWTTHYFGDISTGAPTRAFHKAVETLMTRWDKFASTSHDKRS